MNTLKLKVLLVFTNRHLVWSVSRSIVIWFSTCLLGAVGVFALEYSFPTVEAIVLSLIFSSPTLLLAVPSLYYLPYFQTIPARILFSFMAVLAGCSLIIGIVSVFFHLRFEEVIEILFPFIPAAILSFFIVARKRILETYPIQSIN
jgi:hypothetical protein